ncbi:hypothetical protein FOXB_17589 [Fusarium oxysporum f. sp. conglutinans Fo5176]|uniref:Uncharacterized protein n=1 Tax=Fusarium oxysporum (strain Fo5176) TaxID=660025 RepID=F9GG05_FUSOF|nr:hypothetical protein FOXB_17589 [Fusarium oxysporum f. sp. conglutinans Fo5176]
MSLTFSSRLYLPLKRFLRSSIRKDFYRVGSIKVSRF